MKTSHKRQQARRGFSLIDLTVLMATVLLGASLALPALQQAREDARSTLCRNNLKNLGLATLNYHDAFITVPPGWVQHHWEADSPSGFGWTSGALPFLDHVSLFNQFEFHSGLTPDTEYLQTTVPQYRCPADTLGAINEVRGGFPTCNYSGNAGPAPLPRWLPSQMSAHWPGHPPTPKETNGIFWCNGNLDLERKVVDGTTNTFLIGERCVTSGAGIWPVVTANRNENDQVTDCSDASRLNASYAGFSSRHPGGANFLMCDGSIRFIANDIESLPAEDGQVGTYQRLADRQDGRPVEF